MGRLSRYQQQAIQSAVDRIKKAQAYLMRISEQAPETRYLSFAMGDLQQVMEIDQQRKAKTFGQWEKYLLIQHDAHNFMQYHIQAETQATNYTEARAHRLAELECNGEISEEKAEKQAAAIEKQVRNLLPRLAHYDNNGVKSNFFINGDPRGYALKMHEKAAGMLEGITGKRPYTDWGGYVILCPEF